MNTCKRMTFNSCCCSCVFYFSYTVRRSVTPMWQCALFVLEVVATHGNSVLHVDYLRCVHSAELANCKVPPFCSTPWWAVCITTTFCAILYMCSCKTIRELIGVAHYTRAWICGPTHMCICCGGIISTTISSVMLIMMGRVFLCDLFEAWWWRTVFVLWKHQPGVLA